MPYAAAAAAAAAAAMNLSPIVLQKDPVPEQCEALNLGKKGTNNNNAGENEEDGQPMVKRIKTERSPPSPPKIEAIISPSVSPNAVVMTENIPARESDSPERSGTDNGEDGNDNDNTIEMDIDVTAAAGEFLFRCVVYFRLAISRSILK